MKKIFAIFMISLVLFEISVRILCPSQDRLDRILNILEQDRLLFWRHKPNLDVIFEGSRVKTNSQGLRATKEVTTEKKKDTIRIICLGASPTFGWGVNFDCTYPQQLEKILKTNYSEKNFEVINAGIIGYSSYQGLLFLKNKILKYSPDIITVAYVINDVDKYRFFRSNGRPDKELVTLNPATIFLKNTYKKSRLLNLIEKEIVGFENKTHAESSIELPEARVSAQDYQHNLEEMIRIAKDNGIKIIFIEMPVNLPLPPYISEVSQAEARKHIFLANNFTKSSKYQEAIFELTEAIVLNPYSYEACFLLGLSYGKIKKYSLAERTLEKARSLAAFNCRLESEKYNRIMEEVAAQYAVPLVNIVSAFGAQKGKDLFVDSRLDPIHPNSLGHRIIAEGIFISLTRHNTLPFLAQKTTAVEP